MSNMKITVLLLCTMLSLPVFGDIFVTPATPTSADSLTIRLENHFGSAASVQSASIVQTGPNSFAIVQNVNLACPLPTDPAVASTFQIGPLPPGTYNVTATINFFDPGNHGCAREPLIQTAVFQVSGVSIPALDVAGLLVLAAAIATVALALLRR